MYPTAIQEAGYYVGVVAPDRYAANFIDNQLYMLREYQIKLFAQYGRTHFTHLLNKIASEKSSDSCVAPVIKLPSYVYRYLRSYLKLKYNFHRVVSNLTFGKLRKKENGKRRVWKQYIKEYIDN